MVELMFNNIIWYQYLIVNPYALSTTVAWADPEGGQRVWTCVVNTELNTKAAMPNVVFSDLVA